MNSQEARIRDQRIIEAQKNGLMGFGGKLGVIVRNLGQQLIHQGEYGSIGGSTYLPDIYDLDDRNPYELKPGTPTEITKQIPVVDSGEIPLDEPEGGEWMERGERKNINLLSIGWYFTGLSSGINIEIKYDDEEKQLSCVYEGIPVYLEISGDLHIYVPNQMWEEKIEYLYSIAIKRDKVAKKQQKQDEIEEAKKNKSDWWKEIKRKWGL